MARERTFFGAFNRIEQIITNPCDAPWWLYVRTALPAAGDMVLILLTPQPDEVLEEYLDPSKTRGKSKRIGGGAWRRERAGAAGLARAAKGGFPDPDGFVADKLPGRNFFASRKISLLEHVFWTGFNIIERANFYFLLADLTKDFVYAWHSGIMRAGCDAPELQPAYVYATKDSFEGPQNATPFNDPPWRRTSHRGINWDAGNITFDVTMPHVSLIQTVEDFRDGGLPAVESIHKITFKHPFTPDTVYTSDKTSVINTPVNHDFQILETDVDSIHYAMTDLGTGNFTRTGVSTMMGFTEL